MANAYLMWINILIATIFIWLFWRIRRSVIARPSRLNLRYRPRHADALMKSTAGDFVTMGGASYGPHFQSPYSSRREKSLNVLFMYNGHCWDAFEVLGLPAGSSTDAVSRALVKALSEAQPQSREFLRAAAEAIRRER